MNSDNDTNLEPQFAQSVSQTSNDDSVECFIWTNNKRTADMMKHGFNVQFISCGGEEIYFYICDYYTD